MRTNLHAFIHSKDKTGQDRAVTEAKREKRDANGVINPGDWCINTTLRPLLGGAILRKMSHGGPSKGR